MKGLVIKSTGSFYQVRYSGKTIECRIKGKLRTSGIVTTNPVAVGDWVEFEMEDNGRGMITEISPRKNYIIRKSTNLSRQAQVVAANIDTAYIVITLAAPYTSFGFIDRFLVTCEAFQIPAILVFNKMDQYADESLPAIRDIASMYEGIGYPSLLTSAKTGYNLHLLKESMQGKVSLLSGHSGVGKSSLLSALFPDIQVRIGELSEYHQKGQHTTTFAEMFELPEGGYIVDTPGIKGFGLIDIEKDELALYFPEMRNLLPGCRFYNCKHVNEPGCAVKDALEAGEIPASRYESYLNMLQSDEGPYR